MVEISVNENTMEMLTKEENGIYPLLDTQYQSVTTENTLHIKIPL